MIRRRARFAAALSVPVLGAGLATACDIPTDIPRWDTRWVIPAERTALPVTALLPEGVSLAEAGGAFSVPLEPLVISRSLAEMCAGCGAFNGMTVPKPPFTVTFGGELALPGEVVSATLAAGSIRFRIRHDFPFDPLRPSSAARGYLVLTVSNGSTVLGRDSLNGRTTALPAGTTLERTLPLSPREISGPVTVGITLSSPLGDPVRIDLEDRLTLEVPAADVALSSAVVRLQAREVTTTAIELELGDVDAAISERVQAGAVQLAIENPFDLNGAFELRISTPSGTVRKPVTIAPGSSNVRVELSGEELRAMLGSDDVRLAIGGSVSTPAAGAELLPDEEIAITARLELVVSTAREDG